MVTIHAISGHTITLGREGENLAQQVVFDVSEWLSSYGDGTVSLIAQRNGDNEPYPCTVTMNGSSVKWLITTADTARAGYGRCELRYAVGDVLVKSETWPTYTADALGTPTPEPPEPEQGWVDQVLAVGAAAMTAANGAKADADRAAALAAEVSKKAAQTAQDASDAAKAMEAAQTAQRLAEEAQSAAEAARTAAAAAQAAVAQSATDAAAAKHGAETALQSAQDAAAAAANALESIQTLYQEMQTWAQGVIQDVNAAGSAAVQSVQSAGDAQVQRVTAEGTTQTANAKAQADAAAQSASGAAQSAQEAAESAAVYDTVVADVTQLKQDLDDYKSNISSENKISFEFTKTASQRIESDGSIISGASSYAYVSSLIDIEGYPIIYITARANWGSLVYAFYDADSNFISGKASSNTESSTQVTAQETIVPSNAKFLRLSMTYNASPFMDCYYKRYKISGLESLQIKSDELDSKLTEIEGTETYNVIRHPTYTSESGYVDKHGDVGSGNYAHTNKISVKSGDVIYFVTQNDAIVNNRFVCAYSGDVANPSKGAEYISKYTVPEGIDGVVLSCSSTTDNISYSLVVESTDTTGFVKIVNSRDILYGKKWIVIGDSFSYGGYSPMNVFDSGRYCGSRKTYPYFIGNRTHANVVDFTLGGRTLAYPSDGSFSNSICCPTASCYYQNIPEDADYITIYLGINDSHHASGSSGTNGEDVSGIIPIGTVDDTTVNTFGGAWNVVLSWLIENRPNAHIGIIVSNGVDSISYRELTIAIAKKYGIPYIDLNGDERTPAMIRTVNPDISTSVKNILIQKWAVEPNVNNHPNDDAHEFESYIIENFLRSI